MYLLCRKHDPKIMLIFVWSRYSEGRLPAEPDKKSLHKSYLCNNVPFY